MTEKKCFILYFDAYPLVELLAPEQRGWLFSAVFGYAVRIAREPGLSQETFLQAFPQMDDDTRMACRFICSGIARDTEKWMRQRAARERRLAREVQPKRTPDPPHTTGEKDDQSAWAYL